MAEDLPTMWEAFKGRRHSSGAGNALISEQGRGGSPLRAQLCLWGFHHSRTSTAQASLQADRSCRLSWDRQGVSGRNSSHMTPAPLTIYTALPSSFGPFPGRWSGLGRRSTYLSPPHLSGHAHPVHTRQLWIWWGDQKSLHLTHFQERLKAIIPRPQRAPGQKPSGRWSLRPLGSTCHPQRP